MHNILLDTSVWIDYLRSGRGEIFDFVQENIVDDKIRTSDLILYELCLGARSDKELELLKNLLAPIPKIEVQYFADNDFLLFCKLLKSKGLLGSLNDMMVAFASVKHNLYVFSFDHYFKKLADKQLILFVT